MFSLNDKHNGNLFSSKIIVKLIIFKTMNNTNFKCLLFWKSAKYSCVYRNLVKGYIQTMYTKFEINISSIIKVINFARKNKKWKKWLTKNLKKRLTQNEICSNICL